MKLYVKVRNGSWNTLTCNDKNKPIASIVSEMNTRLGLRLNVHDMVCKTFIKTANGAVSQLYDNDLIADVLEDGDFVHIGE